MNTASSLRRNLGLAALAITMGSAWPALARGGDAPEKSVTLLYFYNPGCRQCDAATAEVNRAKEKFGERLDIRYKDLFDAHTGDAATREFQAVQRAFRVPRDTHYNLGVVIEAPPRRFIGGADDVLQHLDRLLTEAIGRLAPVADAAAPTSADEPAAAVQAPPPAPAEAEAHAERPAPPPAPDGDAPANTEEDAPPPIPDPKDFVADDEAAKPDAPPNGGDAEGAEAERPAAAREGKAAADTGAE